MGALRSLVALLVLVGLLVVGVVLAERYVHDRIEATVQESVTASFASGGDRFDDVSTQVTGYGLEALVRGRLERVDVATGAGSIGGLPVQSLDVVAQGVRVDGTLADAVEADVSVDAVAALTEVLRGSRIEVSAAESATVVGPDRLQLDAPLNLPVLGAIPVQVEVQVRGEDGGLVAEPVAARAVGIDIPFVDLLPDGMQVLGRYELPAADLPAGLQVTDVRLSEDGGAPTVLLHLSCAQECPLQP